MPLDLINMKNQQKCLYPGDIGFLFYVSRKFRWGNKISEDAVEFLEHFAAAYYAEKCPENLPVAKEENKEGQGEETGAKDGTKTSEVKTNPGAQEIKFTRKFLNFYSCGFIATNLPDPSDYIHFVMMQLAEGKEYKTKCSFRVMPVQVVCEARPRVIEKAVLPLIESVLGREHPYRVSVMYRGNSDAEHLTQKEAKNLIWSCVWSVNPNCVQSIRFHDYAVMIVIVPPLFCLGIAKNFQRLAGYQTWNVLKGIDLTDQGIDSDDEVSDDLTLDEAEDQQRKLKLKKKRRAERIALGQIEGEPKKCSNGGDEDHHEEMQEGNDDEEDGM